MKPIQSIFLLLTLILVSACNHNDDPQPVFNTDLNEITSFTENGLSITLFASENFFVGYNAITAKIEDENGNLLSGDISTMPMMNMMDMSHSSPLELPDGNTFRQGTFTFNTVFVMPSGEMGDWSIHFTINDLEINVPVTVVAPEQARLVSFTSLMDQETRYFVTYIQPQTPQIGQNDLEIAVFKRQSMMEWPAVTNLEFELEPWMVSMDHGSPNNVAPIHTGNGHYAGTVNFTMTGDWQVRLTMKENGEVCGTPYFDLFFQ